MTASPNIAKKSRVERKELRELMIVSIAHREAQVKEWKQKHSMIHMLVTIYN